MSIVIDEKFVNLLSPRLPLFKWEQSLKAKFRCPICGDSKKSKRKPRGYIFPYKEKLWMKCHNCTASMPFGTFLKIQDHNLYKEYLTDKFKYKRYLN